MDNSIFKAYNELLKIASAVEKLEKIQEEVGHSHDGGQEQQNAGYDEVERRLMQPWDHMDDWYEDEPVEPKVADAEEYDEVITSYDQVMKSAQGLNERFMHPTKKASYVRKSTQKRINNSPLRY